VSKRYLDLANAYPTIIHYTADQDYQDDTITEDEQTSKQKPLGSRLAGAGSIIEVDMPRGSDEHDPMRNPMKIINPDVTTLEWHVKEERRLIDKIFKSVVGTDIEVRNDAAKNEMQVESAFESQLSVLHRVKKNFEAIHKFADTTIAKLRYGERFIECEIDYGTNFFLKNVDDLQGELTEAKDSGASEALIESINENMLNTKYRDDKQSRQRADIIHDLDPLPSKTLKESIAVLESGGIDKINFIIKSNLINFVRRFEREHIDVVRFGSLGNYSRKIEQIKESLRGYAEEMTDNSVEIKTQGNEIIEGTPGIAG